METLEKENDHGVTRDDQRSEERNYYNTSPLCGLVHQAVKSFLKCLGYEDHVDQSQPQTTESNEEETKTNTAEDLMSTTTSVLRVTRRRPRPGTGLGSGSGGQTN